MRKRQIIRLSKAFKYILFSSKRIWSTMGKSSFRSIMSGHIVARKKTHKWTLSFSRFVTKSFLTLMNASSNKKHWAGHSKNAKQLLTSFDFLACQRNQTIEINDRSPTCAEFASRTSMINNADHDDCLHRKCWQNDRHSRCKIEIFHGI